MRIVLINLKRASERRNRMAREFGALGLPYEIKEAIDGRNLSAEHLTQVDREARRNWASPAGQRSSPRRLSARR